VRIAEAARSLFHARGFEAVITDEIAAAAGVAKGTLFLHAPSKERLLLLAYEAELRRVAARAVARVPRELDVARALTHVFRHFFRLYEKAPDLARRFVREVQFLEPAAAPELERVRLGFTERLVGLLAQRQRAGQVAGDVDLEIAAVDSFLIYYGVLTGWLAGHIPDPGLRDRLLEDGLALLWRGLERPGAPRASTNRRKRT